MPEHITTIRPPREDEFESWAPLFRAYRAFYDLVADEAVVERVWSWIHSPVQETNALIAVTNDGVTVGRPLPALRPTLDRHHRHLSR